MMTQKLLLIAMLFLLIPNSMVKAQQKSEKAMFDEAYTLKQSDLKFANMVYRRDMGTKPILHSIERCKTETKVTFRQPIYYDRQWLHYGKGFKIIDRNSGDEYNVRGYADGIPFGRLLIVTDCDRKYIFITLVFPKLKRSVKNIDLLELPHEDDLTPSNNDGAPTSYYNIKVSDYLVSSKKTPKVYN